MRVKTSVTIDEKVLRAIDRATTRERSRSRVLEEGLKHESSVHCDALVSVSRSLLTNFVGTLDAQGRRALDLALGIALGHA